MKFYIFFYFVLINSVFIFSETKRIDGNKKIDAIYFKTLDGLIFKYNKLKNHLQNSFFTLEICTKSKNQNINFKNAIEVFEGTIYFYKLCKKSTNHLKNCEPLQRSDLKDVNKMIKNQDLNQKFTAIEVILNQNSQRKIKTMFSDLKKKKININTLFKKYTIEKRKNQLFCAEFPFKSLKNRRIKEKTRKKAKKSLKKTKKSKLLFKNEGELKNLNQIIINNGVINYFIFNSTNYNDQKGFIEKIFKNLLQNKGDNNSREKNIKTKKKYY